MRYLTILASMALASTAFASYPAEGDDTKRGDTTPTSVLIDFEDDIEPYRRTELIESLDLRKRGSLDLRVHLNSPHSLDEQIYVTTGKLSKKEIFEVIAKLNGQEGVENVEVNRWFTITSDDEGMEWPTGSSTDGARGEPNDPRFGEQWHMKMIGVTKAWQATQGEGAVVAVIDTGVAYMDHNDGFDDFARVEDLDADRFVPGYDFVADDSYPLDEHGHGTHVAGTVAQSTNNKLGVAGVAPKAKIMPIRVLNAWGGGTLADIVDGIRFAADNGANVINMSLGGGGYSATMAAAVKYAHDKGVIVVCAAGNGGQRKVEYPAAYPGAFAVSSVGPTRNLAFYSSYGPEVAIAAPGGDQSGGKRENGVLQNVIHPEDFTIRNEYHFFQGTSMAAPHVAGAAALLYAKGINNVTAVEQILKDTATPAPNQDGRNDRYGDGILSVAEATGASPAPFNPMWLWALGVLVFFVFLVASNNEVQSYVKFGWAALLGMFIGGGGGALVQSVPFVGDALSLGLLNIDQLFVNTDMHRFALLTSALPVTAALIFGLQSQFVRNFCAGLAIMTGVHLGLSAVSMPANINFIPGNAGALDQIWLIGNSLFSFGLVWLLSRKKRVAV